ILSTGNSQVRFLDCLCAVDHVDWSKVTMFHLDDYLGLPKNHPASFDRYLRERFIDRVHPGAYHLVDGTAADPEAEALRYGELVEADRVDVCFAGIGETGHLALIDPPADLREKRPFFVIDIDRRSRQQLAGEGWFNSWEQCPARAITISIDRILRCDTVISVVPEERKARAVAGCLEGEIGPDWPASLLRTHPDSHVFLDADSAGLLARLRGIDSYPLYYET
ncbi:MAG TPA: 6-phosphogluconolactonase, partial [Candidatus Glassbacteria bacterium]|nr:6-phosphogluconolactonase [Candidatus Glassbacteria bacterium]